MVRSHQSGEGDMEWDDCYECGGTGFISEPKPICLAPALSLGGGGSGGPPKPKKKTMRVGKVGKPGWLEYLDQANSYYRHCQIGMTALPEFAEDLTDLNSFGIPVELKTIGIYQVPVMPWGWHSEVVDC